VFSQRAIAPVYVCDMINDPH